MKTFIATAALLFGISNAIAADKCKGIVRCTLQYDVSDSNGDRCDGYMVVGYAIGSHGLTKTFMSSCYNGANPNVRAYAQQELDQLQKDGVCETD